MRITAPIQAEVAAWLEQEPGVRPVVWLGEDTLTLFALDDSGKRVAFLFAYYREIPAPLGGERECFIYVIDVAESSRRCGIASQLVQETIARARQANVLQVSAYCDIHNESSHRLWLKNGFGISPVKQANGEILGSFVTSRLR